MIFRVEGLRFRGAQGLSLAGTSSMCCLGSPSMSLRQIDEGKIEEEDVACRKSRAHPLGVNRHPAIPRSRHGERYCGAFLIFDYFCFSSLVAPFVRAIMVSCFKIPSRWVIVAVVALAAGWNGPFVKASPRTDRYRLALAQSRHDRHDEAHDHSHEQRHVHYDHSHGDSLNHHHHQDVVDNEGKEEQRHSQDHSHSSSDYHNHHPHDVEKEKEEEEDRMLRNGNGHRTKQNLSCGTRTPEKSLIMEQVALRDAWIQNKIKSQGRTLQDDPTLIVPTCIHVIRPTNDPDPTFLNFDGIQRQLDHLNNGYSSSSCCDNSQEWCSGECSVESDVQFQMALVDENGLYNPDLGTTLDVTTSNVCTTRTQNDDWYSAFLASNEEFRMIDSLRQGDGRVLNIFINNLQEDLLGHALLPTDYVKLASTDGVVIVDTSVAGGADISYGEGVSA
jgi:hypothetical protein